MGFKFSEAQPMDHFIADKDAMDLSRAALNPGLSFVGFDEEQRSFTATVDKILYRAPAEIIATVLHANGYMVNLENILACLDQWETGARVRGHEEAGKLEPKYFMPAIRFTMPVKSRIGDLLGRFYREIELYEAQLAVAHDKIGKKKDGEPTIDDLRNEVKKLRGENESLRASVKEMANRLQNAQHSQAAAHRALETQNLLPEGMRLAAVREILPRERSIILRSNRKSFSVPMAMLERLPAVDDPCLIYQEDGGVKSVYFYANEGQPFKTRLAEVLFVQNDKAKFRDADRNIWVVEALNDMERAMIHRLQRGKRVLLHLIEDQLIRFEECQKNHPEIFEQMVQETISVQQIRQWRETMRRARARAKKEAAS